MTYLTEAAVAKEALSIESGESCPRKVSLALCGMIDYLDRHPDPTKLKRESGDAHEAIYLVMGQLASCVGYPEHVDVDRYEAALAACRRMAEE